MLSADEANRRYFREAYREGKHGWGAEAPSPYAVRFLRRLAGLVPHGRLLDIGCGEGRHSLAAARLGFRVTAIDYEPLALKRARRAAKTTAATGVTFHRANVFSLPFAEASFDIILDYGCLHHQRKREWPLYKASILRVLRPKGYYVLSVFSPDFRLFDGSGRNWHIKYGAYRRCFTRREIVELFGGDFDMINLVKEGGKHGGFWHALMRRSGRAGQVSTLSRR